MRDLLRFVLVGFAAAWIASILARGKIMRVRGCLAYLVFGLAGALAGGYLMRLFGQSKVTGVIVAGAGAIVFLVLMQGLRNA